MSAPDADQYDEKGREPNARAQQNARRHPAARRDGEHRDK
jgi:hypothetical protein